MYTDVPVPQNAAANVLEGERWIDCVAIRTLGVGYLCKDSHKTCEKIKAADGRATTTRYTKATTA